MNRVLRISSLCVMLLALAAPALLAQGNVRVTLRRPPPNQLKVADLWKVDLDNRTNQTFTVYLHGTATESSDGLIVDAHSSTFRLPPGRRTVSGDQIGPITVDESHEDYKDEVVRTGTVRSGNYRVCVEVRVAETDSLLGTDCYDQEVRLLSPPILVAPPDGERITERLPTFTWLPPAPLERGMRVLYRIRVAEILGRQSAFDAIQSNPAWFLLSSIPRTLQQYPVTARGFRHGSEYAWMITAIEISRTGREFVIGESEIWRFAYDTSTGDGRLPDLVRTPRSPTERGPSDTSSGFVPNIGRPGSFTPRNPTLVQFDNEVEINTLKQFVVKPDLVSVDPKVLTPAIVLQEMLRSCYGD